MKITNLNKKAIALTAFACLATAACARRSGSMAPTAPVNQQSDSQQTQQDKNVAQHVDQQQAPAQNAANNQDSKSAANGQVVTTGMQLAAGPTGVAIENTTQKLKLEKDYDGKMLFLRKELKKGVAFGKINITGEDAKSIYDALQEKVEITKGNDKWNDGKKKNAGGVSCFEQSMKGAEKDLTYGCSIYLNYKTGRVILLKKTALDKKNVEHVTQDYDGQNVYLVSSKNMAAVEIRGLDAKMLYSVMTQKEFALSRDQKNNPEDDKRGQNVKCFQTVVDEKTQKVEYTCSLAFDYTTGALLQTSKNK